MEGHKIRVNFKNKGKIRKKQHDCNKARETKLELESQEVWNLPRGKHKIEQDHSKS